MTVKAPTREWNRSSVAVCPTERALEAPAYGQSELRPDVLAGISEWGTRVAQLVHRNAPFG
jgi:hypothetical protein